jgi:hypothetical protein
MIKMPVFIRRFARPLSGVVSMALVLGTSFLGIRALGHPTIRAAESPSVTETAEPSPSPSVSPSQSGSPEPSPTGIWTPYVYPGDKPGCTDGVEPERACAHIHAMLTGINGNHFIDMMVYYSNPEPVPGDIETIRVTMWDPDDPWCCVIDITVDDYVKPTIISCQVQYSPGASRQSSSSHPAEKSISYKIPAPGRYVFNIHGRGKCGSSGGSEMTGAQSIETLNWGLHQSPKPSPSQSPSPSPTPSPSASPTPTPSPSPSP